MVAFYYALVSLEDTEPVIQPDFHPALCFLGYTVGSTFKSEGLEWEGEWKK